MLTELNKTPFPYYGGKADAAPIVWEALGDPHHYVEPFFGSGAVLLRRPHECNRSHYSETVNDADGFLCNAFRAIQMSPGATAEAASWPVCEADLMSRHLTLLKWSEEHKLERLMADPKWHDPEMAGYWIWGISSWIGSGWCSGNGSWIVGKDGRITKRRNKESGVAKQLPHIGDDGKGCNYPKTREPGVAKQLPHIGDDGKGCNYSKTREPGVTKSKGMCCDWEFHPLTMPELRRWFEFISARLRHVRILNGDWTRVVTGAATKILSIRSSTDACGIFLDPPYNTNERCDNLYLKESGDISEKVRKWCVTAGKDPQLRIVLAGYDTEHTELEALGWAVTEWYRSGFLKGGMRNQNKEGTQQHRERLWLSPACLPVDDPNVDPLAWMDP